MKKGLMIFGIWLLTMALVGANVDHQKEIDMGRQLVESKANCDSLSDEQLEAIGEYYMEQMHPGAAHEAMHEMMGMEEGTEYHEQVHVNMAKMMYCGEGGMMFGGMMGNMMQGGRMMPMMNSMMDGGNMMGSQNVPMMEGMMNPFGYGYGGFWNIIWFLFWIGIIALVIWLIYKFIIQKEKPNESAMDILKKRFAKGDVSKKQFKEMKKEMG